LKLTALAALEAAYAQKFTEQPKTAEADETFRKYQLLKVRALAPAINEATQNEADVALRMAYLALAKIVF
jgi:hypothetical protein